MEPITSNRFLKMIVDKCQKGQQFCFILGAGASCSSGIKMGQDLICQWRDELQNCGLDYIRENARKAKIPWSKCEKMFRNDYKLCNEDYFILYDLRFAQNYTEGYQFLEDLMENKVPNIGLLYLGCLLKYTKSNLVITTNFDHLLEDALHQLSGRHPLVLGHEHLARFMESGLGRRPVIAKIHHDLFLNPMNRSNELLKLQREWKRPLSMALTRYTPIVIGYAGGDKTLMRLLGKLKMDGVFWCTRSGHEPPEKAKKIIKKNNGHWVKITDFDTLMYQLVRHIPKAGKNWVADCNVNHIIDNANISIDILTINEDEVERIRQAIKQDPNNAFLYYLYGIALQQMGNLPEALKNKSITIKQDPNNASFYRSRSMSYRAIKAYAEANEDKTKAVDIIPDDAWLYYLRGLALHQNALYEDALKAITQAIRLEPDHASFYYSRSATYRKLDHLPDAQLDIRRAEEIEKLHILVDSG